MRVSVIGAGYVGLVSGTCFADLGHEVTCVDMDTDKIEKLRSGKSPIYEPNLEEIINRNISNGRLKFTTVIDDQVGCSDVIIIAVGTPPLSDGRVDLTYIKDAAKQIGRHLRGYSVIVTKSTVPVGTNDLIHDIIAHSQVINCEFDIVSNPEFLREGTAVNDTFNPERIVIGSMSSRAAEIVAQMHAKITAPIIYTSIKSAELIKYASNAFLATKISFINEIANICEGVDANIDEVVEGIGTDSRIGRRFLGAGIGYGGSCFPKDTRALVQMAGNINHKFELLEAVINVNNNQNIRLVHQLTSIFGDVKGLKVAVLGLAFKPNTDDVREAASLRIIERLIQLGCEVSAYDPVAIENARQVLGSFNITYTEKISEAIHGAHCALIATDWMEIRQIDLDEARNLLKFPVILDGRNCFSTQQMAERGFVYVSIGRPAICEGIENVIAKWSEPGSVTTAIS